MPFSATTIQTAPYTPNGVTSNFPFFFLALSEDEIQVVLTDALGVETLITDGYDVQGIGNPAGGTVVFSIAPNYAGQSLIIRAAPNFAQEADFNNQGPYNPVELNKVLDRLAQKILVLQSRGIGVNDGGVGTVTWASVQGKPTEFTPAPHTHDAADITAGVLAAARIPGLDASKITGGSFDAARVPGLDASKIISGTIDQSRLPPQSGGVVSSGAIADLTAPQQALIVEGTLVTTTDGSQWRYSGTGSKVLEASYVELSTATDWAALTSVPPEITSFAALTGIADRLPYFSGNDTLSLTTFTAEGRTIAALASQTALQARASTLTTKGDLSTYTNAPARLGVGANGQVLTADSAEATGLKWATPAGSSGGVQNLPNFVTVFSGNGDGVTNNDAAFNAAEGSAYKRIYLPEGRYKTTKGTGLLTKSYVGPGVILVGNGTGVIPNIKSQNTPLTIIDGDGIDSEYGESSGQFDMAEVTYEYIRAGTRLTVGTPGSPSPNLYFHVGATGKFTRFISQSGGSGTTAHLVASAAIGATTATLNSVEGLAIGNSIAFGANDGQVTEVVTITNIVGNVITFAPALANAYTYGGADYAVPTYVSGYAQNPRVTRGWRTMNVHDMVEVQHSGEGDAYAWLGRIIMNYTPKAGQTDFFETATGGLIGGDAVFSKAGNYFTTIEFQIHDQGFDAAAIGYVNSYYRDNDTGARRATWIHDFPTSRGSKPIDVFYAPQGKARVGLDLVGAEFSSEGQRAIQLRLDQRIYFDAAMTAAIGTRARGFWGNVQGTTYLTAGNDGTPFLDVYAGNTRVTRSRASSLNVAVQLNANDVNVASGRHFNVQINGRVILDGIGGNTYLTYDGGTIRLFKEGFQVASW